MATSFRRRSLVRRLTLRAALWAAMLGLTLVALAVWQYWRVSRQALDARLLEDAQALAAQITVREELLDIDLPPELGSRLDTAQGYYGVYDRAGRLLHGAAPQPPDPGHPVPAFRTRDGHREAITAGVRGATVIVGRPLGPIQADVRRLAASLLVASLVVVAVGLAMTVWLRRQLAVSVGQIDRTARLLAPGQPARIDAARIDDEFVGVAGTLNAAFDRLEHALARERQFTADASHELRTPVAALVAETAWALGRPREAEEYRQSLEVCARQARRMKELAENLLLLARIDTGPQPPRRDPVDVRALADEAAHDLRPLADERRITVHVEGDARVSGDPVQLRTLIANLLSNAIRYNRPDGEVRVRIARGDGEVRVEVADTGAGLEADQVAQVFDRFWRADGSRAGRDGGSGLGLAISRAVVTAHGGTIGCQSVPRQGTTFTVALPA